MKQPIYICQPKPHIIETYVANESYVVNRMTQDQIDHILPDHVLPDESYITRNTVIQKVIMTQADAEETQPQDINNSDK